MKLRKKDIWLTVNRLGVPPPEFWASRKWKEPAFLLTVVDTLVFPLVDIISTALDLNFIQVKKEFYLYINLAIGLITGGLIEERKQRFNKNNGS